MADDKPLVRLRRRGGSPPADWEMLEVRVGGDFSLWRTVMRPSTGAGRIVLSLTVQDPRWVSAAVTDASRSRVLPEITTVSCR